MKSYSIQLTEHELSILNEALIAIPYKFAAPLISSISKQIEEAQAPTEDNVELGSMYSAYHAPSK